MESHGKSRCLIFFIAFSEIMPGHRILFLCCACATSILQLLHRRNLLEGSSNLHVCLSFTPAEETCLCTQLPGSVWRSLIENAQHRERSRHNKAEKVTRQIDYFLSSLCFSAGRKRGSIISGICGCHRDRSCDLLGNSCCK